MTDHHGLIDAVAPRGARPGVKRIMVADGARVIVFRFAAGQILAEHKAAFPILVQSIDGHIEFTADGRTVDLHPGDVAHLSARLLHEVRAVTDATLLLTMLDPAAATGEE
ncbi:cupin domain-containing protein [Tomitella fengzijianii]|uniref:Cupin domain-containing protein n=2 Tax=Tomitella fengzijianii TaxID=2597660 RepID=A0A516X7J3_9ACTN|nr:cupin domain-containing protein [Tomitella fengzijianii]